MIMFCVVRLIHQDPCIIGLSVKIGVSVSKLGLKFIYSEKATKFCEISANYLSYVLPVKWLVEILQNFCGLLKIYEL